MAASVTTSTMPPPHALDILPALSILIVRLLRDVDPTALSASQAETTDNDDTGPMAIKDLASRAARMRVAMDEARQTLAGLPDMHASIEEQETEIVELERRIAQKRGLLDDMANAAAATEGP